MSLKPVFIPIIALLLLSCIETTTELKLKIYAQGAGFDGTYSVDGEDDEVDFSCTSSTSDVYTHIETVTVTDTVVVNIFPLATSDDGDDDDETDMTALTCRIFDVNGDIVYDKSYTISTTAMKTFAFDIDDILDTES